MRHQLVDLPPRPISVDEYHDHYLVGITLRQNEVEWEIESPTGTRACIKLTGVNRMLGMDILEGNIVDCIDCHHISPDNLATVLAEFRAAGSAYFSEKALRDIESAGTLLGKVFVAIRPIHGASILAIADAVAEEAGSTRG